MLSQGRMTILAAMTGRMTHFLKKHLTRAESPQTITGSPDHRITGSPDHRITGSPDHRITGMSALAWRRPGRSAARPEPSATTARHLRRRLAAALLALPLLALAAGAQAEVLASNIGQPDGGTVTFEHDHAQFFLAGGNAGGYRLESVDIEFASATRSSAFDSTVLTVEIRRLVGTNDPGALVGRLTNPTGTSFSADRLMRFTAPASGIDLDPFGQYFLVLDVTGQRDADFAQIRTTASSGLGVDSFSITNARLSRPAADNTGITTNWQETNSQSLKIRLNGMAKAPPGLEFSTTQLSWNEADGCTDAKYYGAWGQTVANKPSVVEESAAKSYNILEQNAPGPTYM